MRIVRIIGRFQMFEFSNSLNDLIETFVGFEIK